MSMYYPLQIPSLLDKDFVSKVQYNEYKNENLNKYIMCIWSMNSYNTLTSIVNNVILPDGCIDLIIDLTTKEIYFSGNSKATLNFPLIGNIDFIGIRFKPGVFYDIFKTSCIKIMDNIIPYDEIETDYKLNNIFDFDDNKDKISFLMNYLNKKTSNIHLSSFTERLNMNNPKEEIKFVNELADYFGYSVRQLNRIFKVRCGVSVKTYLNIIRLHNSLKLLINNESDKLIKLAHESGFYDEAHFIKEINKYCGISPKDLIKRYKMS